MHLSAHLMARNRNEKQIRLIWILCAEMALPNVLKEESLTGILPGELPRSLVKRIGISVGIYVDLEISLHRFEVQLENLRQVVNVRKDVFLEDFAVNIFGGGKGFIGRRNLKQRSVRGVERGVQRLVRELQQGEHCYNCEREERSLERAERPRRR